MFDVFVARAGAVKPLSEWPEWDRLELGDFVVASVFALRREEWIEKPSKVAYQPVGQHGANSGSGPSTMEVKSVRR